jgi:DNA-binding IclR family transcriptional regulator
MMQRATSETASPPTGRVLDVLELLAQRDRDGPRLTDVIEELGITRATAHSILTTLCDRGWASRDPAPDGKLYPVTALSAPVFDHHDRVVLNLAIHPFRPLTAKQIEARGRRLTSTTSAINMMDPQEEPHR